MGTNNPQSESSYRVGEQPSDSLASARLGLDRAQVHVEPEHSARRSTRWPFRHERVGLKVQSGSGVSRTICVLCRNVSVHGVGVIASEPLEVGRCAIVSLPHPSLGTMDVMCTVRRCDDVRPGTYELGLQSVEPINVSEVMPFDPFANQFHSEHMQPALLTGTICSISTLGLDHATAHMAIKSSSALQYAALDAEEIGPEAATFDALILAKGACQHRPNETLAHLFAAGFCGKIILLCDDRKEETRRRVLKVPFHAVLVRPVSPQLLQRALFDVLVLNRKPAIKADAA